MTPEKLNKANALSGEINLLKSYIGDVKTVLNKDVIEIYALKYRGCNNDYLRLESDHQSTFKKILRKEISELEKKLSEKQKEFERL